MRVPSPCSGSRDGKLFVMSDANTLEVRGITMLVLKREFKLCMHVPYCFPMDSETGKFELFCTFAMTFALLAFAFDHCSSDFARCRGLPRREDWTST